MFDFLTDIEFYDVLLVELLIVLTLILCAIIFLTRQQVMTDLEIQEEHDRLELEQEERISNVIRWLSTARVVRNFRWQLLNEERGENWNTWIEPQRRIAGLPEYDQHREMS